MPDNTVDDIIKNGTKDYCSPLYAAEMYAKGLCPLSDVEAAIRSAIEEKDKRIAELEKQWISVEDRLPDFDIRVLVWGESTGMNPQMGGAYPVLAKRQDLSKTSFAKNAERYQDKNQFSQMSYVTHWMPLPAPPSKDNKKGE